MKHGMEIALVALLWRTKLVSNRTRRRVRPSPGSQIVANDGTPSTTYRWWFAPRNKMAVFGLGFVRKELRSWAHKTPEFKKRGLIKNAARSQVKKEAWISKLND